MSKKIDNVTVCKTKREEGEQFQRQLMTFRLQARCCLNSGDAPGALRILNSMERGDLKLLARIEVVLHDNQFAKTASTLKSVSYIRDFNQIALRSILDEFSQSKPSRELVIEAGRLLYDVLSQTCSPPPLADLDFVGGMF